MVIQAGPSALTPATESVAAHWEELAGRGGLHLLSAAILFVALGSSLWFANAANAGEILGPAAHLFDFVGQLAPREPMEVVRALFDLPSPFADGQLQ